MARGNIFSLGFSGISFLTKSMGMIFFTWLGVSEMGLDFRIYVPILTFFWFFSHLAEAFVIQHYMEKNVQIKQMVCIFKTVTTKVKWIIKK